MLVLCELFGLLALRVADMRREKVVESCLFPKKKPKHDKCELADMIRRSEEEYVDFQEAPAASQ